MINVLLGANSIDLACIIHEKSNIAMAILPDTPRFETPMAKDGTSSTYPRGLALDDRNALPVRAQNAGEADLAPVPLLWCLTDEGVLLAYQCISWDDQPLPLQSRLPLPEALPKKTETLKKVEPKAPRPKSPTKTAPASSTAKAGMANSQKALKTVTSSHQDEPIITILLHLKSAIEEVIIFYLCILARGRTESHQIDIQRADVCT